MLFIVTRVWFFYYIFIYFFILFFFFDISTLLLLWNSAFIKSQKENSDFGM